MPATTRINRIAIGDSLRRAAARRPDKTALIEGTRRLSYRQLDSDVNRFANHLLGLGLVKGDTVATLCLNSTELVITAYGIAKAGLVWVPINALMHGDALRYILQQTEAKLVIADDELLPRTVADIAALCPRLLVIPATGIKLLQWTGRAIRTEDDHAAVICYDKRLTQTTYGRRMLNGLPPYRVEQRKTSAL